MADVIGKKISELAETTELAGLYTIGSDKNNQSKKVPLQFVKEAADYANAQGDYAKGVGDTIQGNTGVNEYPAFSSSTQYAAGSVVRYNDKLYRFTALHPAGAWVGTDAIETSIKAETDAKVTELSANLDKIDSDAIHIADAYGNIILTIDAEGIHTTDVEIQSGKMSEVISAIIEGLATKLGKEIDSDSFQIQDANGNIAFRIDSEGVHTPKSDSWIVSMILGETYIPISTQRDENGDVQSAEIVYPDGNKGNITITSRESNGVTAMVIGYKDRVVSVTMERDSHGNVNKINIA